MRHRLLFPLLLLVAGLAACRTSTAPAERKPYPVQLRSVVPGEAVRVYRDSLAVAAAFNQEMAGHPVRLQVVPPPRRVGAATISGHSVTWPVQPALDPPVCWFLMDGPDFLRPYLTRFFLDEVRGSFIFPDPESRPCYIEGDPGWRGTIQGEVFSRREEMTDTQWTLVLAYPALEVGQKDPLRVFAEVPPVSLALADLDPATGDMVYELAQLVIGRLYGVMAVRDTSGDGLYDIRDDWWTWGHEEGGPLWAFVVAHIDFCAPILALELRPPTGSGPAP